MSVPLASPRGQLWLLNGESEQQWGKLEKRVTEHPFNHAVEIIIPNCLQLPAELPQVSPRYYTAHLPLSHFIQPQVCAYYRDHSKGSLSAISLKTHVDTDCVFAVLPNGILFLSVDKDTYEQLGLQGKPSHFQKHHRFLVEVDLKAPSFQPGKPNYERVQQMLTKGLKLEGHFAIARTPINDDVNTEADFLKNLKATEQECLQEKELLHGFPLPVADGKHPHGVVREGETISCNAESFHTWLGTLSCGLSHCKGSPGDYVSTFVPPEPHSICQYGMRVRWSGMVSCGYLMQLLESVRLCLKQPSSPPWIAVNVWGFEDSPISWLGCEHGYGVSGENHYTVVLFQSGYYWCLSALGTLDMVR